jgi:TolB-like protein
VTGQEDQPAPGQRPTAFLSYARENKSSAAGLVAALEQAGIDVWWDSHIEGGAAFARSIEAALEASQAVVVLWSQASVTSDWVLDEASRGRSLRKLVPVTLDGTKAPLGFGQYHVIDLSGWKGDPRAGEVLALVRAVKSAGTRPAALHRPAGAPAGATASRRGVLLAAAGAVVAGGAGLLGWRQGWFGGSVQGAGNSVAVLPFKNLSGDADQDYFSDGLSEELRATLARNLNLQVMAQASTSRFRQRQEDAVTIAAALGVAFLLDGSVRRSGSTVRVTADLVDGATGFSRWSEMFERGLEDIFAVQSEIARTVARALAREVAPEDEAVSGATASVEAYDAYLRGRALYDLSVDEASEQAALAQFDAAIAADPDYAAAHAARSRSLTAIANAYGQADELAPLYAEAIAAARRAIELAPGLADAHSTLGNILFQGQLDAAGARAPFDRSRELGAGEATVLARFSLYCARTGREREAGEAMQRALVLDKLNPLIHRAAGAIRYAARDWAGSIPPVRQALEMNPRLPRTHGAIADALLMQGQVDAARAEYLQEPHEDHRLAGLAIVERRLGDGAAARQAMDDLLAHHGDRSLYQQAQVLAQWGEQDAAVDALRRALRVGDSGLIYSRNDPFLDPLRGDPGFAQLLSAIGFV